MTRSGRILSALAAVAVSAVLLVGLTYLGRASAGPVQDGLDAIGAGVTRIEQSVVELLRGPGRRSRLEWLEPYRENPERLKRPDRVLLGVYDDQIPRTLAGVRAVEDTLGLTVPLIHHYVAWGDRPQDRFPGDFLRAVRQAGSLPVVSWEPWLVEFEAGRHPGLRPEAERKERGLRAIADGRYDFYVDRWARRAAEYGDPILLRFAHEMNDPYRYPWGPQNNRADDFIAAWRHVVERFEAAGADNVLWVWSPHVAYEGWDAYWPGDEYVDWVATAALNYGTAARWSEWYSFRDVFGRHYEHLSGYGKPVMVAEFGSLPIGGDRAEWYREALEDFPDRYPAVKSVILFHSSHDATVTASAVDWQVTGSAAVARAVREALDTWPRHDSLTPRRPGRTEE